MYISYRTTCSGGGVVVCVRKLLVPFITRLKSDIEECIFLSFNETMFAKPLIMSFTYIAHEQSEFYRNKILKGIERFEVNYADLNNANGDVHWLICGDLNSRVCELEETLINNNIHDYIQGFDECEMIAEGHDIPRRTSRDTETNTFGRQLIQFCKINDFLILNGRTTGDATGSFTCIANKGRSIVDYFIVSRNMYMNMF